MLSLDNVSFKYESGPPLFRGVSFELREGSTTAVLGPSGCGKTTLLKLVCGLLLPTTGSVIVNREQVILGRIRGLVFHEDTLLPWLRVLDNVLISPARRSGAAQRAHALLTQFGLCTASRAYPHELSAGMRKRVEFARALISDDKFLLLDEPFVSLDRSARNQLWEIWRTSPAIRTRTKLIVTHDLEEVRAIADYVLILDAGRPVNVHPPVIATSIESSALSEAAQVYTDSLPS